MSVFVKESYFHPSFYRQLSVVLRKCEFKYSKFLQIKSIIEFVKKYRWSKTGFWTQTKSVVSMGKTFAVCYKEIFACLNQQSIILTTILLIPLNSTIWFFLLLLSDSSIQGNFNKLSSTKTTKGPINMKILILNNQESFEVLNIFLWIKDTRIIIRL